jgi:hypothetical protein
MLWVAIYQKSYSEPKQIAFLIAFSHEKAIVT